MSNLKIKKNIWQNCTYGKALWRPSEGKNSQILKCKYLKISPQWPYLCQSSKVCSWNGHYYRHIKQLEYGRAVAYSCPKRTQKWSFLALLTSILKRKYLQIIPQWPYFGHSLKVWSWNRGYREQIKKWDYGRAEACWRPQRSQ